MRNAYKILVGNPQEKRLRGRIRCRCDGNIKINFSETVCEAVDCLQVA